jgi:hypothetical protein
MRFLLIKFLDPSNSKVSESVVELRNKASTDGKGEPPVNRVLGSRLRNRQ